MRHSVGEYVRGQAPTNGIESFWSILKRAHKGTFHKLSPKHLDQLSGGSPGGITCGTGARCDRCTIRLRSCLGATSCTAT